MKKYAFSTLILAGLLSGCSMAPTYERPEAPVPAAYPGISEKGVSKGAGKKAIDIGWREFFKDARLQSLIQAALENNRDLRVAALRIEEARALYHIQRAERLPTLNAAAGGSKSRIPADLSSTSAVSHSTRYDVSASIPAFEIDFFGRVKSLSDAALATYLATEEAQRAAHISLVSEVAKAYLAERAYAEQYVLAEKTYQAREKIYKLAQLRFSVGAASALDLADYESLRQAAKASMLAFARQRAQAENALAVLVGKPLTDLPSPQMLSSQNVIGDIYAGLPSELLQNRPDIRQAEQSLMSANANIGAARAAFFPRIALTGSYGTASSALSGLFESGSRAWTFAPQLTLPIFDAGSNLNNLDLAWARKNIAVAQYEKTIQVAFREVADALVARKLLTEQVEAQAAFMRAEKERLELSKARYANGVASSLDLLDAERQLFLAEQTLVQTQLLELTNSIDLYRSLGGGINDTLPFIEKKSKTETASANAQHAE